MTQPACIRWWFQAQLESGEWTPGLPVPIWLSRLEDVAARVEELRRYGPWASRPLRIVDQAGDIVRQLDGRIG